MPTSINVSADLGPNITHMLEQLANKIGTTTDKIFPWYMKQSVIEGWTFLLMASFVLVCSTIMFFRSEKKADWNNGNVHTVLTLVSGVIALVTFIILIAGLPEAISQILNPEYNALHVLMADIGKMTGK